MADFLVFSYILSFALLFIYSFIYSLAVIFCRFWLSRSFAFMNCDGDCHRMNCGMNWNGDCHGLNWNENILLID